MTMMTNYIISFFQFEHVLGERTHSTLPDRPYKIFITHENKFLTRLSIYISFNF